MPRRFFKPDPYQTQFIGSIFVPTYDDAMDRLWNAKATSKESKQKYRDRTSTISTSKQAAVAMKEYVKRKRVYRQKLIFEERRDEERKYNEMLVANRGGVVVKRSRLPLGPEFFSRFARTAGLDKIILGVGRRSAAGCKHYLQGNGCRFGLLCRFLHDKQFRPAEDTTVARRSSLMLPGRRRREQWAAAVFHLEVHNTFAVLAPEAPSKEDILPSIATTAKAAVHHTRTEEETVPHVTVVAAPVVSEPCPQAVAEVVPRMPSSVAELRLSGLPMHMTATRVRASLQALPVVDVKLQVDPSFGWCLGSAGVIIEAQYVEAASLVLEEGLGCRVAAA